MQCLKESLLVINLSKSNHVVITLLHNPVYWKMMLCLLLLCFKAGSLVVLLLLWVILYWCQCKFKKKNYMLVVLKLRKVYVACCVRHDADGWTNWVLYAEPAFILLTLCACVCVCTTARCTVFVSCLALQGTLTMLPLSLRRLICLQFLTVVWNRWNINQDAHFKKIY